MKNARVFHNSHISNLIEKFIENENENMKIVHHFFYTLSWYPLKLWDLHEN